MIRVFVLYEQAPDPDRYAEHVELNRRETKKRGEGEYTYLFTLNKYWTLDGAFGGSGVSWRSLFP